MRFADGMIANLNTSRVAPRRERKIRFFQPDAYISVDYEARRIQVYRKSPPPPARAYPVISAEQIELGERRSAGRRNRRLRRQRAHAERAGGDAGDGLRVMELSEQIPGDRQGECDGSG